MKTRTFGNGARWLAAGAGIAAGSYAAYAAYTWLRYGHVAAAAAKDRDELLDRFMPDYEVVERHEVWVNAPAATTYAAAKDIDLDSGVARLVFNARALALGGAIERRPMVPQPFVVQAQTIGWRVLAEMPGSEIVLGAVTRPWEAQPAFRGIPAADFAAFAEPDYVKIILTLRADPAGDDASMFRTETRACTTDAPARRKFRLYWAFVKPGVALIRRLMLAPVKREAERRAQDAAREDPLAELRRAV
jgi:hypothetical protein